MLKQLIIMTMSLVFLAGCATTKKLASDLSVGVNKEEYPTPLEQVLSVQPELLAELNNTEIRQVFNTVESPTVAQITILQSGLLDDSVDAIRTTYRFKLNENIWKRVDKNIEYKCLRGKNTKTFQKEHCA